MGTDKHTRIITPLPHAWMHVLRYTEYKLITSRFSNPLHFPCCLPGDEVRAAGEGFAGEVLLKKRRRDGEVRPIVALRKRTGATRNGGRIRNYPLSTRDRLLTVVFAINSWREDAVGEASTSYFFPEGCLGRTPYHLSFVLSRSASPFKEVVSRVRYINHGRQWFLHVIRVGRLTAYAVRANWWPCIPGNMCAQLCVW